MYEQEKKKLKSLMHKDTYKLLKNNKCFLAGGSLVDLFRGADTSTIKDLDVYFRNSNDALKIISELKYHKPTYADEKSIIMSPNSEHYKIPINIITFNYFDSLDNIFKTYDFTVCMGGYDFEKEEFGFDNRFFKDNMANRLTYSLNSQYPLGAVVRRMDKYQKKGFRMTRKELLKMVLDCFKLNLNTPEKLKEQIAGMYGTGIEDLVPEGEEFTIPAVTKALDNMKDVSVSFEEFQEFQSVNIGKAFKDILKIIKLKDSYFYQSKETKEIFFNLEVYDDEKDPIPEEVDKVIFPIKAYKFVRKLVDGRLVSLFNKEYEYKIGRIQIPEEGLFRSLYGYMAEQEDCNEYEDYKDVVRIEMEIGHEDDIVQIYKSYAKFNKVRILSIEEPKNPNICIDPMSEYNSF